MTGEAGEVTALLERWGATGGGSSVSHGLRRAAARRRPPAPPGAATPAPPADEVVHEAYLRLRDTRGLSRASRDRFYAFAAHVMRRVLVDRARDRNRLKRGWGIPLLALDPDLIPTPERAPDLLAVDDALKSLERADPRKSAIVEMRFFGGFTLDDSARILGISVETAGREWRRAKASLRV